MVEFELFELPGNHHILHVHTKGVCGGTWCVIHKPMNTYDRMKLIWRDDRGIFEVVCEHGIGHPAPEQGDYWLKQDMKYMEVHGCCGCCAEWRENE